MSKKVKKKLLLWLIEELTQRPTGVSKNQYKKKKKKSRMFKASRINSRNNAKKQIVRLTEEDPIQVCSYIGSYPNHEELENIMVKTKAEAFDFIERDKRLCKKKWNVEYNYRIIDFLNRFKPIFIETYNGWEIVKYKSQKEIMLELEKRYDEWKKKNN